MSNWVFLGKDGDVLTFFNSVSLLMVNVVEKDGIVNLYRNREQIGFTSPNAFSQFMFDSELGDVVKKVKVRSNAEDILAEVLDAIGRLNEITRESVLDAMSPLKELNTADPYYNSYIKDVLGDNHLYQSQERLYKGVEWVWIPQHIAGGMRVTLKCYDD